MCSLQAMASSTAPSRAGLTLDDVFKNSVLSEAAVSPDGEWIVATVIRPVDENGVCGRSFYEMDVTRADVAHLASDRRAKKHVPREGADAIGLLVRQLVAGRLATRADVHASPKAASCGVETACVSMF